MYVAELRPTPIQPDHYSFGAVSQIVGFVLSIHPKEAIMRYVLYIKGKVDPRHIPTLCSFFYADLSDGMRNAVSEYRGVDSIQLASLSSNRCMFIPESLRRNMLLLSLSDMPLIVENSSKRSAPLSIDEVRESLAKVLQSGGAGVEQVCCYLKQQPSVFVQSLDASTLCAYLLEEKMPVSSLSLTNE